MAKAKSAGTHKTKKGLLGFFMNLILWIFSDRMDALFFPEGKAGI